VQYTRPWSIWVLGAVLMPAAGIRAKGEGPPLTIYLQNSPPGEFTTVAAAEAITVRIFSEIGLRVDWQIGNPRSTDEDAIALQFDSNAAARRPPGVLAFTMPFDDTHRCVHILYDRVRSTVPRSTVPRLLGHVMAHEITHLLEHSDAHAQNGLMKAHWTASDYAQMAWQPLAFAAEDVERIRAYRSGVQIASTR
jgi:hypothetical protein